MLPHLRHGIPDVKPKQLSCGLLVINERDELLIGHSTGSAHWDIPKGLIDPGETPFACALRESKEEFGLVFDATRIHDLGRFAYYAGKDLHLFAVRTTSDETRPERCTCSSDFEDTRSGRMMPEIDAYGWGSDSVLHSRLGKSMHRLLLEKNLLATARATVGADMAPSLVGHSL